MGLKILHSADWHLDSPFASFSEEKQAYLQMAQVKLVEQIPEISRRENCDLVLLAGDIFDAEPRKETVNRVKTALEDCGVPVFVAPGNHDPADITSVWRQEIWPDNVHIFLGGMESVLVPGLDCRVWGAGYQSMDCPGMLEGFCAEGQETHSIGLLHADPVTKNSPYCPVTAQQIRNSGFDYLALGHIHKAGMLRFENTVCAWPGCPMGRGWDETGEKGICIVTLGKNTDVRFLPLDTPRFYDLEWEGTVAQALEALLPPGETKDFYRITLTGERDGQDAPAQDHPCVTFRDRREEKTDIWSMAEEDSLRGLYFSKLRELAREDPVARKAAEISARILAGKEVVLP